MEKYDDHCRKVIKKSVDSSFVVERRGQVMINVPVLVLAGDFDLIVLDVMLPGLNGLEVLRRIRRESAVPVIMLTARDAVMDKVSGLDAGADCRRM